MTGPKCSHITSIFRTWEALVRAQEGPDALVHAQEGPDEARLPDRSSRHRRARAKCDRPIDDESRKFRRQSVVVLTSLALTLWLYRAHEHLGHRP